jgi:hypothetical protein
MHACVAGKKKGGGVGVGGNIFDSLIVPGKNVACIYDMNSRSGFVTGLTGQIYENVTAVLSVEFTACKCEAAQADKQCHSSHFA